MTILEQLVNILKLLKVRPASGFGKTEITWFAGEIVLITKIEDIKPEEIN